MQFKTSPSRSVLNFDRNLRPLIGAFVPLKKTEVVSKAVSLTYSSSLSLLLLVIIALAYETREKRSSGYLGCSSVLKDPSVEQTGH